MDGRGDNRNSHEKKRDGSHKKMWVPGCAARAPERERENAGCRVITHIFSATKPPRSVIRENPASRGTETSDGGIRQTEYPATRYDGVPTRCSTPPTRRRRSKAWAVRIRSASAQLCAQPVAPSPPTRPPTLLQWAAGNWTAGCAGAGGPPCGEGGPPCGEGGEGGMAARRGAARRGSGGGGTSSAGAATLASRIQGWRSAASAVRRLLGS